MPAPAAAAAAGRAATGARTAGAAGAGKGGARAAAAKPRRGAAGGAAGDVAGPTAADNRSLRTELAGRDAGYQAAFEAGRTGDLLGDEADQATRDAWQSGADERRRERRGQVLEQARGVPSIRGPGIVNDGAGFLLGLVLYALALNYLQGGAAQARGWVAAKFINKPMAPRKAARAVAK